MEEEQRLKKKACCMLEFMDIVEREASDCHDDERFLCQAMDQGEKFAKLIVPIAKCKIHEIC